MKKVININEPEELKNDYGDATQLDITINLKYVEIYMIEINEFIRKLFRNGNVIITKLTLVIIGNTAINFYFDDDCYSSLVYLVLFNIFIINECRYFHSLKVKIIGNCNIDRIVNRINIIKVFYDDLDCISSWASIRRLTIYNIENKHLFMVMPYSLNLEKIKVLTNYPIRITGPNNIIKVDAFTIKCFYPKTFDYTLISATLICNKLKIEGFSIDLNQLPSTLTKLTYKMFHLVINKSKKGYVNLHNLERLDLSFTNVKNVDYLLQFLPNLQYLVLRNNPIQNISIKLLNKMKNLRVLNIKNTLITHSLLKLNKQISIIN